MRLATHVEVIYGDIKGQLASLGDYIVMTMEPAWSICEPFFRARPPIDVVPVATLDQAALDALNDTLSKSSLRPGVSIVGVGGGTVLDAAKYIAYLQGTVPLLVPSITSTNAPFSDFISIRRNGGPFGFKVDAYPKKVVIDYELIRLAEPRYNRAGYGDLLYMQTTLNDWRLMAARGIGVPLEAAIEARIAAMMDESIAQAAEIGSLTVSGVHLLMDNTRVSAELLIDFGDKPIGAGSEHLFAWNMDLIADKPLVHGEIVSLGIVIASFLQAEFMPDSRHMELRKALDLAKVRYRPEELDLTWDEVKRGLLSVEAYNARVRGFHTVFELAEWTPPLLERIRAYIYSESGELE